MMRAAPLYYYWLHTSIAGGPTKAKSNLPTFWKRLEPALRKDCCEMSKRLARRGVMSFMFCGPDGAKEIVIAHGHKILVLCARSPIYDTAHLKNYGDYLQTVLKQQAEPSDVETEFKQLPELTPDWVIQVSKRVGQLLGKDADRSARACSKLLSSYTYFAEDTRMFRILSGLRLLFVKPTIKVLVVHRTRDKRALLRYFNVNPTIPFPLRPPIVCYLGSHNLKEYEDYRAVFREKAQRLPPRHNGGQKLVKLAPQQCLDVMLGLSENSQGEMAIDGLDLSDTAAAQKAGADGVFLEFSGKTTYRQDIALASTAAQAALDPTIETAKSVLKELSIFACRGDYVRFTDLTLLFSKFLNDFSKSEYHAAIQSRNEFQARLVLLHNATARVDYSDLEENQIGQLRGFVREALGQANFRNRAQDWGQRLQEFGVPLDNDAFVRYASGHPVSPIDTSAAMI